MSISITKYYQNISFYWKKLFLLKKNPKQAQLGVPHSRIQVELSFILQAGTCQILNFAENPRQSQSLQGTEKVN